MSHTWLQAWRASARCLSTLCSDGSPLECVGAVTPCGAHAAQAERGRIRATLLNYLRYKGLLSIATTALPPGADEAVAHSWLGPRALLPSAIGARRARVAPWLKEPHHKQYKDAAHPDSCAPYARGAPLPPTTFWCSVWASTGSWAWLRSARRSAAWHSASFVKLSNLVFVAHGLDIIR